MTEKPKRVISRMNVPTQFGRFRVEATEKGLYRLCFPGRNRGKFRESQSGGGTTVDKSLSKAKKRVQDYFRGKRVSFRNLKIDWSGLAPFERKVLKKLYEIHYGELKSYGNLARLAGEPRAARAVGSVMAKNRLPIILPCHRVIASGGGLGGYGPGRNWKRRLLEMEQRLGRRESRRDLRAVPLKFLLSVKRD